MLRSMREEGSLVVALLASIVVGGLAVALVGTTMTGQKKVQHDRNFQLAINGAEAGVNDAITRITTIPTGDLDTASLSGTGALSEDEVTYEWGAVKDTLMSWRIDGTGERNGVTRRIEALAVRDGIFFMAAFADVGIAFKGGNIVQSYSATKSDPNSGNGAAGSNGQIYSIGAGSSAVDLVMLMGSGASCDGNVCETAEIIGFSSAFDLEKIADNIREAMETSCNGNFSAYDAATGAPLQGGTTYCFSDVKVGAHGQLPLQNHSQANPVRILMTGTFSTGNQAKVNCGTGCSVTNFPDASALQIYSTGPAILLGNHSEISGAIAAPYATCKGNPSVAQADVYGAIICNDMGNQGGWNFFFDERLLDLGSGQYEIQEWREEVGGSTSWPD
jgi:hypothetical protein